MKIENSREREPTTGMRIIIAAERHCLQENERKFWYFLDFEEDARRKYFENILARLMKIKIAWKTLQYRIIYKED